MVRLERFETRTREMGAAFGRAYLITRRQSVGATMVGRTVVGRTVVGRQSWTLADGVQTFVRF